MYSILVMYLELRYDLFKTFENQVMKFMIKVIYFSFLKHSKFISPSIMYSR